MATLKQRVGERFSTQDPSGNEQTRRTRLYSFWLVPTLGSLTLSSYVVDMVGSYLYVITASLIRSGIFD